MTSIDKYARETALRRFGLPPCLHIPIAARNEESIENYIGEIVEVISKGNPNHAFLVTPYSPQEMNTRLRIWELPETQILHNHQQVWVHVNYSGYRSAYFKAFPELDIKSQVLDHVLNRRVARLKGFDYLRIVSISRGANSSSGGDLSA